MATTLVAVTGGVASGKSEATRAFEALGVSVVDADVAAREVVAPGQPALQDIVARFGRFPHRNAALGRTSTPEEVAFLQDGPRFGQ